MAEITCALDDIPVVVGCRDRGGIREFYWTDVANVDWDAMEADATKFNQTNQEILGYVMEASSVFNKVEFDAKAAFYDFTFTRDSDVYALLISAIFAGKDRDRRNKLVRAIECCRILVHIVSNTGVQRVVGIEWTGDNFVQTVTPLAIGRHLDSSGQLGQSKGRDEIDLTGESFKAPLFANVPLSSIPL